MKCVVGVIPCFLTTGSCDFPASKNNLTWMSVTMVSCTWGFLGEWGFLRHRVRQTWRSVHGTWPPSGKGKDLHSLGHSATHRFQRDMCFGCGLQVTSLSYLFWSNYGSCPLWHQVLCRCCTAFWTGACPAVCCLPSEGPKSLFHRTESANTQRKLVTLHLL